MSEEKLKNPAPRIKETHDQRLVCEEGLEIQASLDSTPDLMIGEIIGEHYEILSTIGSGGLGVVYKAHHKMLNRPVAIKFLVSKHIDGKTVMRFQREAETAITLKHPYVGGVQEFGVHKDVPYLVMEFVEGEPLSSVIEKEGKLDSARTIMLLKQALQALSYAHKKKIIHRDIKPGNILISRTASGDEEVKLIDFGIAKIIEGEDTRNLTQTGEVFGTPKYMSPEQCYGKKTDFRSDLYSLGCVAYEMVSGSPPFTGESAVEILMKQTTQEPPPLKLNKTYKGLEQIIDRAMAKDPKHRYQTAEEMLLDIGLIEEGKRPTNVFFIKPKDLKLIMRSLLAVMIMISIFVLVAVTKREVTIQSLTEEINSSPQDATLYYKRAQMYEAANEMRPAISDLIKTCQLYDGPLPRIELARCYRELGEYEKCIAEAEKALSFDKQYCAAHLEIALAHNHLKHPQEAMAAARNSIETNPTNQMNFNFYGYQILAEGYEDLQQYKDALVNADKALELLNKSVSATWAARSYYVRGNAERHLNMVDKSIVDLSKAIELNPKYSRAIHHRAHAYLQSNNAKDALEDINRALILAPSEHLKKLKKTAEKMMSEKK